MPSGTDGSRKSYMSPGFSHLDFLSSLLSPFQARSLYVVSQSWTYSLLLENSKLNTAFHSTNSRKKCVDFF